MTARSSCHLCHGTGRVERLVGWEAPDVRYDECYCATLPNDPTTPEPPPRGL